jgi:diguanylate cyclase (GGDEF)-like protein
MRIARAFADKLRRPHGLATRAIVFTTGLIAVTASLSAATLLLGAEHESVRHQLDVTGEFTERFATSSADLLAAGRLPTLQRVVNLAANQPDLRRLAAKDGDNHPIAEAGGSAADQAAVDAMAARVLASGERAHARTREGLLVLGAPIIRDSRIIGAAVMLWEADAYRIDTLASLAPFLLILGCLAAAAVPVTVRVVRKAVAPLDELTRYAERIADRGEASAIDLNSGDEFETLAKAFNKMTTRLDASMRQIQQIAFVDPVTRLSNQERFVREIDFFILKNTQHGGASVALFELQRLSRLLQTLAPEAGRDFLRLVAERLASSARIVDRSVRGGAGTAPFLLARLGGAEFGVLTPGVSQADAARLAQHLTAALNEPFEWRGHKFTLGACCGVAMAPRDGADASAVLRHARLALGAAQASAGRVKVFTPSLDREAVARLTLEREMRGALERNEFRAYFQPKVNLVTGRIEACEALARWIRPDRTIISPGRFIPVAEESGLIGALSDAIMREACWKAAAWARAGQPTKIAVNVSTLQFRTERFAENVLRIVQHAGLSPALLELEITESMVMEDPERAVRAIAPLREAGVRFAIDDFGCGHSSLSALSKLPFDVIKIDQQFVRGLDREDSQSAAIVEMILALGRTLGMEIVAEGVERREDVAFMAARGCHWVQGFLYGAAVPAQEFAELLRRQAGDDIIAADAA